MARNPTNEVVDLLDDGVTLPDYAPALSTLLRDIDTNQHALMTAWGSPGRCVTVNWSTSTSVNALTAIRVPPGIEDIKIGILAAGIGDVLFTTDADATGVRLRVYTADHAGEELFERADWVWGGIDPNLTDPEEARALGVRGSGPWTWSNGAASTSDSLVTAAVTALSGHTITVYAIAYIFLHKRQ